MASIRRWRRPLIAVAVVVAVVAAGWVWHRVTHPAFPDQLPGGSSDVSAQQALEDHRLMLPQSARDLRYSANRGLDDYPLAATFAFDCTAQEQFIETNDLAQVAQWYQMLDVGAYNLADNLGWRPGPAAPAWLERAGDGWIVTVVVQPANGGACTAYLTAGHPIEAGEGSPLGG